jgi:ubiquinone/menaquinone biosynthesis C-methylase UbiE
VTDDRKQATADVFDRAAETYDQLGVDFFTPMGRELAARAGLQPGERVLDLGAGRGAVTFAAAEAVGTSGDVAAIDLSPVMVELLRAEARDRGLAHVHVAVGDAESPDVVPASFDALLAGLVLFMLPDPRAALRRHAELLRGTGRLAFTTFAGNDPGFEAAMREIGRFVRHGLPPREERQGPFGSPETIEALLAESGFTVEDTGTVDYESRFTSPDHWLSWAWSHGGRFVLEQLREPDVLPATQAAKAAFESTRTRDGEYVITTTIRFTVATPVR